MADDQSAVDGLETWLRKDGSIWHKIGEIGSKIGSSTPEKKEDEGTKEAVRKYMDAAYQTEAKRAASRKASSDPKLGQKKKTTNKTTGTRKKAAKRG